MGGKSRRIGIYGGSFDPVHCGHIGLARALQAAHKLDGIYFIPALISPHKNEAPHASFQQRIDMLELAIHELDGAQVLPLEGKRPKPSYSIDTVESLIEQEPETKFYLLLGDDSLARLHEWKRADELLALAPPLVGSREPRLVDLSHLPEALRQSVEEGLTNTPITPVSATEVRQRLIGKKDCHGLVPEKVLDYIQHFALYSF